MRGIGYFPFEIARDHGQGATGQIAESVCKVGVIALDERIKTERSILPKNNFAQQEVAQRVRAQHLHSGFGAYDVAARLRHLALFEEQPAMGRDALRQRQSRCHQECRPIHAMETHNLFADHVHVGRPEFVVLARVGRAVSQSGDVVRQRVEPDIDHMLWVIRHRNAPRKGAAADREIAQAALHEGEHFITTRLGSDEFGLLGVKLDKAILKGREFEKIILLFNGFGGAAAFGAGRARANRIHIELVRDAVLAGVVALVNETGILDALPQSLHALLMARRGGADVIVVTQPHAVPQRAEFGGDLIGKLLRRFARCLRRPLDLLPMLVSAGEEPCVVTQHAVPAGNCVARNRGIGVPDVGMRIDVINRSRDVELLGHDFFGVRPGLAAGH